MLPLERPHRFCLKFMQNLPRNTKTEVVLNLLASKTIEEEIDRLKPMFLNSYVICQAIYLLKKFFIHRLVNYFDNPRRQVVFIPDMHSILEKYSLTFALQDFMEHGRFFFCQNTLGNDF